MVDDVKLGLLDSYSYGTIASPSSPRTIANADGDINIKPTKEPMSPSYYSRRTFVDRTFSKLEKGSIRGSIFSLCSAAIGGGVLSLPFVFVLSGWLAGISLIIIGAIAGIWSNLLIAKATIKHKIPNLD